ncbi:MAG: NAD-dependent epimerase [Treponema sp.]|jgi:UDP-glucuronate 4-epimerase|nr:NAD-dependent epimerase [Treponema sp.]
MKILVTGSAGFIGMHLAERLSSLGHSVFGIDNINDYYDPGLKYARLEHSGIARDRIKDREKAASSVFPGYVFVRADLRDSDFIFSLFREEQFDWVCNLAAQAGVRYSLQNPHAYIDSNITGFLNILEACRKFPVKHLVFASSSSVYGLNRKVPFAVTDAADHPASLYAATKRSNELMAHTYAHLYRIPATGLRFFTVYGPWGRPDMAYFKFARAIIQNKPIEIYNNGNMKRDFTYIEDIIDGSVAALNHIPRENPGFDRYAPGPSQSSAPFVLYNLGNNHPENLLFFIETLENALGRKAEKIFLGMQAGDLPLTAADIDDIRKDLHWEPKFSIAEGLRLFVEWFYFYQCQI